MTAREDTIERIEMVLWLTHKNSITVTIPRLAAERAVVLLKEQKQIKSPDEFKSLLLGMFDSIWDVEIDHPVFQDTVGELMEGVLRAYRQAVKWDA